ncbi:FadR family transcriptional regulator [Roseibium sp. CAU 1637]|uniref:Pyruvate dehydrogenase complex repressor n=1 Tax=Roseibium limicola TaxID=2816037 RepID=A0A939EQN5_9HYPH|nr:FadR/GntR family transcriptional regulator [Roseibium limicola]MBO0346322.1 FadR family transcriptional regulator [Roseibium limicola]
MLKNAQTKETRERPKLTLADRVYHSLYSRITNGEYPLNQKLPSEHTLSDEFGVSRPVLRLALEKLRTEGVIYSRQGAGNYVRAATANPVGFAKVQNLADVQRCYEFRITIETAATRFAAERRDTASLEEIREALDLMRAATGSHEHREDADFTFHLSITKASNNHYYEAAVRALREHIYVGMKMHGQSLMTDGSKALETVLEEHTGIYEAIRDQKPAEAEALMLAHLEHSRDRLFGSGLLDLRIREK